MYFPTVVVAGSAVRMFKISDQIIQLITIQFDPKPVQLFKMFEFLFKRNIYKEGTVSQ